MRTAASLWTALSLVLSLSIAAAAGCASSSDEALAEEDGEAEGAAKVTLWQSADGEFRFHVAAGSGQVLLLSDAYTSRTGAINGILSVLDNGVDPARYAVVPADGGYLVRLVAANRQTIASSAVHATEEGATRAIAATVASITGYLDRREAATGGSRVEMIAGATGEFRFHVLGSDGEVLLSSESYASEAAAYNGALAVQQAGRSRAGYTVKQSAAGSFYFVLQAANGEVIGTSQMFAMREGVDGAIAQLIALLPTIAVL
jgi:uncharacterized protein YegP (UPF0339 family)